MRYVASKRMKRVLDHKEAGRVSYDLAGTTVISILNVGYRQIMAVKG